MQDMYWISVNERLPEIPSGRQDVVVLAFTKNGNWLKKPRINQTTGGLCLIPDCLFTKEKLLTGVRWRHPKIDYPGSYQHKL